MELKEGLKIEESKVMNVLDKIHSNVAKYYLDFKNSKNPMDFYSITGEDNFGVLAVLHKKERTIIFLSFEKDVVGDTSILEKIKDIVLREMEDRNYENVEFKVNGFNKNVNTFFVNNNFKPKYGNQEHVLIKSSLCCFDKNLLEQREYRKEHLDDFIKLRDKAFLWIEKYYNQFPPSAREENREIAQRNLEAAAATDNLAAFWKDDSLAGYYLKEEEYLSSLAVNPDFQGKGFGNQMLNHCLYHMFEVQGLSECRLDVAEINEKAQNLYKKKGFKQVSAYRDYTYQI